jgi:hypothetical protein
MILAVGALFVAGCGGSSTKTYATKASFAAALNSICASLNAKVKALGPRNTPAEIARTGARYLVEARAAVAQAKKIAPPDSLKRSYDDFLKAAGIEIGLYGQAVDAAAAKETKKMNHTFGHLNELDAGRNIDARALGARACVVPGIG